MKSITYKPFESDAEPVAIEAVSPVHFYIPSFAGGGAERFFVRLVNELAAQGQSVRLIVNNENGPVRELLADNVSLHVLGVKKGLLGVLRLASYLRSVRAQCLISALTRTNIAALISAQLAGVGTRVVVCERNQYSVLREQLDPIRRALIGMLVRVYYPRAHAVIGNTTEVAEDIAKCAGLTDDKTAVIHNAAPDEAQFVSARAAPVIHPWLEEDVPVAVAAGRLMPQKDYRTMLEAVSKTASGLRLIVLGDGPERASLESYAAELDIADRVAFMGFRMDRFKFLVRADLFLMSSITEGFPNALIEAVAAGVPAISTDCAGGGAREIMGREFPERIVPVQDAEAMVLAIDTLLEARGAQSAIQDKERITNIAKRYEISKIANAFVASAN